MTNPREFAELLDDFDIEYLATSYELEPDFVRGMNDAEWCAFLGCGMEELAYYLFDETKADFPEFVNDELEFDDLDDFDNATLFDIEAYLQEQATRPSRPEPAMVVKKKPSKVLAHDYSRPSAFGGKSKVSANRPIPHHFELVK